VTKTKRWGIVGIILAATALTAAGCKDLGPTHQETQEETLRHAITSIKLDLVAGDITLSPGAAGEVALNRRLKWTSNKPTITEKWAGNVLSITTRCAGTEKNCATDYVIQIPADVVVEATTDAGDMKVSDAKGRLNLHTDSGRITGTGLSSTKVDAVTDAGDIRLELSVVPDAVTAKSDAGDVEVAVPRAGSGADGYRVQATTNAGDKDITVDSSPAGKHSIVVSSDAGNLKVRYVS
jgi:hypothetical protein